MTVKLKLGGLIALVLVALPTGDSEAQSCRRQCNAGERRDARGCCVRKTVRTDPRTIAARALRRRIQAHENQGSKYLAAKQYAEALAEYQTAYKLSGNHKLLLTLAEIHRLRGNRATAIEHYRRYLSVGRPGASADLAREKMAEIRRESAAEAARAKLEAEAKRKARLAREKAERERERERLERERERRERERKSEVSDKPRLIRHGGGLRIAGIATAAAGVVAFAIGVKFAFDARGAHDDLDGTPWEPNSQSRFDEGESADSKMVVFYGIGATAVVVGGVLYYLGWLKGRVSFHFEKRPGVSLAPRIDHKSAGIAVSGWF